MKQPRPGPVRSLPRLVLVLRISATDASTLGVDDASKNVTAQYSLTLTPL